MTLLGQRWEYRIGNSTVFVDNAFSWSLWCQERLVVNDETLHGASGWLRFSAEYSAPWLTEAGEETLHVKMSSRLMSVACRLLLGDDPIDPHACYVTNWTGVLGSWPDSAEWQAVDTGEAIGFSHASDR